MSQIIDLPDGTKGEFPDDMSSSDIEAVLQKQYPKAPEPPEPTLADKAKDVAGDYVAGAKAAQNALFMGAAPNITAAGNYAWKGIQNMLGQPHQDLNYHNEVEQAKQNLDTSSAEHPVSSAIGSVIGAAGPALASGGGTIPAQVGKNALIGAVEGANAAPADANLGEVAARAGEGAALGGVTSGSVLGAAKGINAGMKSLGEKGLAEIKDEVIAGQGGAIPSLTPKSNPSPMFVSAIDNFIKDTQPSVMSKVKEGFTQGIKEGTKYITPTVGLGMMSGNLATIPAIATAVGGAGLVGAAEGATKGGYQLLKNKAIRDTLIPSKGLTGETSGASFNQLMQLINNARQNGTPDEATDYSLSQSSPEYRDLKKSD